MKRKINLVNYVPCWAYTQSGYFMWSKVQTSADNGGKTQVKGHGDSWCMAGFFPIHITYVIYDATPGSGIRNPWNISSVYTPTKLYPLQTCNTPLKLY